MTAPADRFEVVAEPLDGLFVLARKPLTDERGVFERMFCAEAFRRWGVPAAIAQINHSLTRSRGTIRGMHFQRAPGAEVKVISCLAGEVYDVAVDVRAGSPTFLRWHGERLSAQNRRTMVIPAGFAHGFQALTEDCALLYLHTAAYAPDLEMGLHPLDPRLKIDWPLAGAALSPRDRAWPYTDPSFQGIAP